MTVEEEKSMLKKIFQFDKDDKITNDFLEEQVLIKELLDVIRRRTWWTDAGLIIEKPLEYAIASKNTRNLINSNTKLADSNKKYQRALNWLTWWLVFVGLVQIIIQIFKK